MTEIEIAEIERIKAEIRKINAEASEIKKRNSRWIRILKYVGAGIALGPFIWIYITQVISPITERSAIQNEINQKYLLRDKLHQDSVRRAYEIEKQSLQNSILIASEELQNAYYENSKINDKLDSLFAVLANAGKLTTKEKANLEKSNNVRKQITSDLDSKMNNVRSVVAANQSKLSPTTESLKGWLFVGHFKNNSWGNTNTLEIGNSLPNVGKKYTLTKDYWVNEDYPKAPLYTIPKAITMLEKGTIVEVTKLEEDIGFNKVWVEIKTMSGI